MRRKNDHEGRTRLQQGEQGRPEIISEARIVGVPEPLQRYLRYAQVIGKAAIRAVHLSQRGDMRMQPGKPWLPFVAHQSITTNPGAFLWHARVPLLPFVWLSATDRFSQDHGSMRIHLLSFIPLGQAHGPEIDQGELQRYLAEMIWYPTAWLTSAIEWHPIDAHSVQATLHTSGIVASVVLHVNAQGQVTRMTADRYKEEHGHYLLASWSVQCDEYQEVEGIRIPFRIAITWHLPSGDFTWFRCRITHIDYHEAGREGTMP